MIDTRTVGKTIALLRRRQQLTQQGLAAAVNVSHQAVSKWENGVALPDMQTMLSLSRLFGVTIEELLNGTLLENEAETAPEVDDEAPATPLEEPAAPRIELKLDANPLNMNLVQQADDVVARALENCVDELEAVQPEEAQEPEERADASEAADQGEQPGVQKTVTSDMTFAEIVHMAPYVSRDALEALLEGCEDMPEMSEIVRIAPFCGRDALEALLSRYQGSMDWDTLRRLAPFLGKDALAHTIFANLDAMDWSVMPKLAPFLNRDALAEILQRAPEATDFAVLKKLAPFLSRDALAQELERRLDELDVDALISFAPFLSKNALCSLLERMAQPIDRQQMIRLARFLPREQMDRLVYRSMGKEPPKRRDDDWRVDVDLGSALSGLGSTISDAVQGAMREAREAIHSVRIDDVMDAVNSAMKDVGGSLSGSTRRDRTDRPEAQNEAARERSIRIRNRIAEKAFSDGNWDWIDAHIDEVTGDMLKKILMNCAAAGHGELLEDNVGRVELSSAEACRLAQTTDDEDVWRLLLERMEPEHVQRVIDYIAQRSPESLDRFARFVGGDELVNVALRAMRDGDGDLSEFVEHMNASELLTLVKAALAEDCADMESLLEHVDGAAIPDVIAAVVDANRLELIPVLAERLEADDIPAMAELLARNGHWDEVAELLEQGDDLDLNGLWPLALEQGRDDMLDEIASHADEATLRNLAMKLAEEGRFEAMDSFLDELDADVLEQLLEKAMAASDWEAIDRIDSALNG